MRQFQLHLAFSALDAKDARLLSQAVETMVSSFCHRDEWTLHTDEEAPVYGSTRRSVREVARGV